MLTKTDYSFKKITIFSIAIMALCFWSGGAMAQSEQEKSGMENEKPVDRPLGENHSELNENQMHGGQIQEATPSTSYKTAAPKKEVNISGEGKKAAPSTLSFNIFLYIVDKFKAD